MNNKEYVTFFKERKWKLALDAMPLNTPRAVSVETPNDLLTLRARASEYGRDRGKKVSVRLDFDNLTAIVTVTKK